jgi:hypothetical protein
MNTTGFPSDKYGIAQSPKILSIVLLVVFVVGLSAGAVLSNGNILSNTDSNPFKAVR